MGARAPVALGAAECSVLQSTIRSETLHRTAAWGLAKLKSSSLGKAKGRYRPSEGSLAQSSHPCTSLLCKTGSDAGKA